MENGQLLHEHNPPSLVAKSEAHDGAGEGREPQRERDNLHETSGPGMEMSGMRSSDGEEERVVDGRKQEEEEEGESEVVDEESDFSFFSTKKGNEESDMDGADNSATGEGEGEDGGREEGEKRRKEGAGGVEESVMEGDYNTTLTHMAVIALQWTEFPSR